MSDTENKKSLKPFYWMWGIGTIIAILLSLWAPGHFMPRSMSGNMHLTILTMVVFSVAAAPVVAGVYAIAGPPAPGSYPASYPYANAGGLNDITTGSTSTSTCTPSYLCTAGTGYDAPTGLGTPDGVSAFLPAFLPAGPVAFNPAHGTEEVYAAGTSGTPFQDSWSSATGWLAAIV